MNHLRRFGRSAAFSLVGLVGLTGPALAQSCQTAPPVESRSDGVWLAGDLHLHSRHSRDSSNNDLARILAFAEDAGLGFLAITDHDNHVDGDVAGHTWADPEFQSDAVILLYGAELTTHRGHANTFSATPYDHQALYDVRHDLDSEVARVVERLGVHVSANHPMTNDPFSFSYDFVDSIEVWNSVLNASGTLVWDDLLKSGRRITGRGGSDAHHGAPGPGEESGDNSYERWFNYAGTPTTWVHVPEASAEGVIAGLDEGRASISVNPYSPRVELFADLDQDGRMDVTMGDTACATGRPARFEVRLSGGSAVERKYAVTVIRNGGELMDLEIPRGDSSVRFEDTPDPDGLTYYRVVITGRKDGYPDVGLSRFVGGNLIALSNPIYFNYPD